jgi:hypothetical protein
MSETSKPITMDQYDRFTLPIGKALSILELIWEGLPADQSNGVIAAQDLIREAQQIVEGWIEKDTAEKPEAPGKFDVKELCITINEALELASDSNLLIQCVRAELAGKPPHCMPLN